MPGRSLRTHRACTNRAVVLAVAVAATCLNVRAARGDTEWVDMAGVRLTLTRELRPAYSSNRPRRGFLGSDRAGAIFAGCSDTGCSTSNPRVWWLGHYVPNDQRVWAKTDAIAAISRRATDFWVLGRPGLFRLRAGEVETVGGVHAVNAPPVMGIGTGVPPPRVMAAEEIRGSALAVDSSGVAWVLDSSGAAPWAYIPGPQDPTTGEAPWCVAWFNPANAGRSALAADPRAGVWLYTPPTRDAAQSLLHLEVQGTPPDAKIAVADDSPWFDDMPAVAYPCMTVAADGRIFIVGQTLEGDRLIEVAAGDLTSQAIPHEVLHGRHVTALDVDTKGRLYLASDGAGVLTYKDGQWGVHPITEHLPVLEGSDLKPVDDILVTDDGTLYAACQFQVVIWKPDEAQP